jgi:3-methyladenine DNA glycosylase/8-oxoguanine DNA glycosylase
MDSETIMTQLTSIRGVGPWTVEMLLIFKLGRIDILPVTDYGVRKGFALTYKLKELPTPVELHSHGEKWSPYRSVAAWYLWRSLD